MMGTHTLQIIAGHKSQSQGCERCRKEQDSMTRTGGQQTPIQTPTARLVDVIGCRRPPDRQPSRPVAISHCHNGQC